MPPDVREVAEWVRKANHDTRMAELAMAETPPITDGAAFHCQQAAEKLLKAFLAWRHYDFEKTHDLRTLLELCADHDAGFLAHQDAVEPLTAYAVRFRYPGPSDPTIDEVHSAISVVRNLEEFVLKSLPSDAKPN